MARIVTYDPPSAKPHPETASLSGIDVLALMRDQGLEQVVVLNDTATGLSGFIVIHDTTRGPAIGGCRLSSYASTDDALLDAVRLAVAMTRKCALAGLNAGGGKGVLIDHAGITDRTAMLRALGRYVESLGGRFYTSGDLGLHAADIAHMRETSRFVAVPDERTLDLAGGVASGVLGGMRATLAAAGLGRDLTGRKVVVQGLGAMGARIAALLVREGAVVTAADTDPETASRVAQATGVRLVAPEAVWDEAADLFCPCAESGVLTLESVARLRVRGVVGAANNQLATPEVDAALSARGVLYAPDYAVNSGAIILSARAFLERRSDLRETIVGLSDRVEETVGRIFGESARTGHPPQQVADRLADDALVRPRSTERQFWPQR
jgi:leucine dehydrogenase